MSMIDEETWGRAVSALERPKDPTWLDHHAEVQQLGEEAAAWFLIDDIKMLEQAPEFILEPLRPVIHRHADTAFSITFLQYQDGRGIIWESLEDDDLCGGPVKRPLGTSPFSYALGDSELFPDAVGPD